MYVEINIKLWMEKDQYWKLELYHKWYYWISWLCFVDAINVHPLCLIFFSFLMDGGERRDSGAITSILFFLSFKINFVFILGARLVVIFSYFITMSTSTAASTSNQQRWLKRLCEVQFFERNNTRCNIHPNSNKTRFCITCADGPFCQFFILNVVLLHC